MIQKFVENIENIIALNPIVLSSNILKQFGPQSETVKDILNEITAIIIKE